MRLSRFAVCSLGVFVAVVLAHTSAWASTVNAVAAPEIDATSLSAGLGLVAAGVMILRARRGR